MGINPARIWISTLRSGDPITPLQAGMPIEATRTGPLFTIEGKERRGRYAETTM
jgi:hypothetical protein